MSDEMASGVARRCLLADLLCVVAFATIGRASHGESLAPGALLRTGVPFLVGLVVGWVIVVGWRIPMRRWLAGIIVWACTLVVGMVVRHFTGQGVAVSFVLVAAGFLGLTLVGWRAVMMGVRRIRRGEPGTE